ncbi:MAG: potassium-transporting ATPase subunit KdpA, partial [Bdellovibrionales bacterium]|nr:potassium-transporting ATPase subunit KdpA [Bdellovibrionales bacterium]
MRVTDWVQIVIFLGLAAVLTPILGRFIARVCAGESTLLSGWLRWVERTFVSATGISLSYEQSFKEYLKALFVFHVLGIVMLVGLLFLSRSFPGGAALQTMSPDLAMNLAISFLTNTNWQSAAPEVFIHPWVQVAGFTLQHFLSAAAGLAVFFCLARCLHRQVSETIGNFWQDLVRALFGVLLPLSLVFAVMLLREGVPQTMAEPLQVQTLEKRMQTIPTGWIASQTAIKMVGSNGGGYFQANGAHPFENPTPFSNLLSLLAMIMVPAACLYAFGAIVRARTQSWMLLGTVFLLFGILLAGAMVVQFWTYRNHGGFAFEGQEYRFGTVGSILWSVVTTATSNGSVNAALSSLSPMAGGVSLISILLGEVVFGGVGVGAVGLLFMVL